MDKGIRPECNRKFMELLPQRAEMGNTAFRKAVMNHIVEGFGITVASASTHYNHSFKEARAEHPELVEGLGRPEDKKGGRKPKAKAEVAPAGEYVEVDTQVEFSVKKKSDGSVVVEGLSFEAARKMVQRATEQKKAKLYWV